MVVDLRSWNRFFGSLGPTSSLFSKLQNHVPIWNLFLRLFISCNKKPFLATIAFESRGKQPISYAKVFFLFRKSPLSNIVKWPRPCSIKFPCIGHVLLGRMFAPLKVAGVLEWVGFMPLMLLCWPTGGCTYTMKITLSRGSWSRLYMVRTLVG